MRDATAAGFGSRAAYAACRKRELRTALERAGFGFESQQQLDFIDQDVSFELPTLTRILVDLFQAYRPAAVITHPYEGGHPDHDGVAFAVDCARRLIQAGSGESPTIIEMTSYHNRAGLMQTGEFLPDPRSPVISLPLNPEQSRLKHELLETFISQEKVLDQFSLRWERFRLAPNYNFQQPPHQGTLFYEQYGLGWDAESWREVASQALTEIGISLEPDGA
jgi:LmbE family N-acetylglucosaminyl deacetylase